MPKKETLAIDMVNDLQSAIEYLKSKQPVFKEGNEGGKGRVRYDESEKQILTQILMKEWTDRGKPPLTSFANTIKEGFYPTIRVWFGIEPKKRNSDVEESTPPNRLNAAEFSITFPELEAFNPDIMREFWKEKVDEIEDFMRDKVSDMYMQWNRDRIKKRTKRQYVGASNEAPIDEETE